MTWLLFSHRPVSQRGFMMKPPLTLIAILEAPAIDIPARDERIPDLADGLHAHQWHALQIARDDAWLSLHHCLVSALAAGPRAVRPLERRVMAAADRTAVARWWLVARYT